MNPQDIGTLLRMAKMQIDSAIGTIQSADSGDAPSSSKVSETAQPQLRAAAPPNTGCVNIVCF